jgi:RNA polymerase sigma-70 factor, ECF subfamily
MSDEAENVNEWLRRFCGGEPGAEQKLIECLYSDLHRLAHNYMRHERPGHTIQPTALVNEAYLKMIDRENRNWQNKAHFLAAAAVAMRRILIDHARAKLTQKHGGECARVPLDDDAAVSTQRPEILMALDEAMERLAQFDAELARLVEWKFFGGLSDEESAQILGVSTRTVKRRWSVAKAWLYGELNGGANPAEN